MSRIDFELQSYLTIEDGLDRCVVYAHNEFEPWFGMVSITEDVDLEASKIVYVDGTHKRAYAQLQGFTASISSYTYPALVEDGSFGMTYRTMINGKQCLHLVYGCQSPSIGFRRQTIAGDPFVDLFEVSIQSVPERRILSGFRPASHLMIMESDIWEEALQSIGDILYGTETEDPRLPPLSEVVDILETYVALRITDHGDGTWSAEEINTHGIIKMVDNTEFEITWDSALYIDDQVYTIQSL